MKPMIVKMTDGQEYRGIDARTVVLAMSRASFGPPDLAGYVAWCADRVGNTLAAVTDVQLPRETTEPQERARVALRYASQLSADLLAGRTVPGSHEETMCRALLDGLQGAGFAEIQETAQVLAFPAQEAPTTAAGRGK